MNQFSQEIRRGHNWGRIGFKKRRCWRPSGVCYSFGCEKLEICEGSGEPENNRIVRSDKRWLDLECSKMSKDPNVWSTGRGEESASKRPFVVKWEEGLEERKIKSNCNQQFKMIKYRVYCKIQFVIITFDCVIAVLSYRWCWVSVWTRVSCTIWQFR